MWPYNGDPIIIVVYLLRLKSHRHQDIFIFSFCILFLYLLRKRVLSEHNLHSRCLIDSFLLHFNKTDCRFKHLKFVNEMHVLTIVHVHIFRCGHYLHY